MIKKVGEKWVLFTKDGSKRLGTHDTREEAVAQERAIEISKHRSAEMNPELREYILIGATGKVETKQYNGRDFYVVPVVALMEGVIHAVNAETPEFVSEECLAAAAHTWNGRPLVINHPTKDGVQISANNPTVLEQQGIGHIFESRMNGKRLGMQAWVDPTRLETLGHHDLLKRIKEGKKIEVSVGAFVRTMAEDGEHNKKKYKAKWAVAAGDHLAILPNSRGACSVEMGCGLHRHAEAFELTDEGMRSLGGPGSGWSAEGGHVPGSQGGGSSSGGKGGKLDAMQSELHHKDAAKAYQDAASAVDHLAYSTEPTKEVIKGAKDAVKKAIAATKKTGAQPYAMQAAQAYLRMADKAKDSETREKHLKEAQKMLNQAASWHKSAAKTVMKEPPVEHKPKESPSEFQKRLEKEANWGPRPKALPSDWGTLPGGQRVKGSKKMRGYAENFRAGLLRLLGEQEEDTIVFLTLAEASLDDRISAVNEAVRAMYADDKENKYAYARCVYDDYVIISCDGKLWRMAYEVDETNKVTLTGEKTEVRQLPPKFVPVDYEEDDDEDYDLEDLERFVAAAGARHSASDRKALQTIHDNVVELGAECKEMKAAAANPGCKCGGHRSAEGGDNMDRIARIKALTENKHNPVKVLKALEAMSDEELTALETHCTTVEKAEKDSTEKVTALTTEVETLKAAAAKTPTDEEYLKTAPPAIKTLVETARAAETKRKDELVEVLKTAQSLHKEEALKTFDLARLEEIAALVGAKPAVDYSGARLVPRAAGENDPYLNPPNPYGDEALKAYASRTGIAH